ncbi:MAG TPA: hypothetical protein VGL66_15720 [Caulobacteraceae bacterium]|jgi:hypothetical protein
MYGKAFGAGVAAALIAGAALAAPSDWASSQLKDMDSAGFGQAVDGMTFEGSVAQGQDGKVAVTVPAEGRYALVASCGEDCTDIGLILQQNGQTVAEGVSGFKAALKPGAYVLNIGFDNCKSAQCRWVVRAYKAAQ